VIKIGDFARLGHVSIVTLRHYDEIDLLKPVAVDSFTGYRYYSVAQLPRLNRILALKDLGFSLEQIEVVLSGLTLDQLRGMLKLRHAEVEQQVVQEQGRLARIATRLRQIESEETMSNYDVVLKTIPPMLVASRRVTIPTNDQVPHETKIERMERLVELTQGIARSRNEARVGCVEEVLVEGRSRTDETLLRGRTRRNTTVNFEGTAQPGELVPVLVESATSTTLRGTQSALVAA